MAGPRGIRRRDMTMWEATSVRPLPRTVTTLSILGSLAPQESDVQTRRRNRKLKEFLFNPPSGITPC